MLGERKPNRGSQFNSITKLLTVTIIFVLAFSSLGTVFADEIPDLAIESSDSEVGQDPVEETAGAIIPDQEGEADSQSTDEQAESQPAEDGIEPLASTYPYHVDFDQVPNSSDVKVSLPNISLLEMLGIDSITVDARMFYKGSVLRNPVFTISLTELTNNATDSFVMPFADYGKFTVSTKFLSNNTLIATGDSVTVGVTANEYNIALPCGTLPATMFAISLFGPSAIQYDSSSNIIPTIFVLERPDSINWDKLPNGVYGLPFMTKAELCYQGDATEQGNNFRDHSAVMSDYVAELFSMNPAAHINLYVSDIYIGMTQSILYANRIPQNQYKIIVLSDGVFSYNKFNTVYAGSNPQQTNSDMVTVWNSAKERAYANGQADTGFTLHYCNDYVYAAISAEPNAVWWVTRYQLFSSGDSSFTSSMNPSTNSKVYQFSIMDKLNSFSSNPTTTAAFKSLFNLSDTYFPEAGDSGKEIMVLLGTAPAYERDELPDYARLTMAFFGDDYVYYYKGHPASPTEMDPAKQAMLDSLLISDIYSSIPAEFILFFYPEIYLSGYNSTTYTSVPVGMGKFMFDMTRAQGLANPLYENMDAWVSRVNSTKPANIQALCPTTSHRYYLVEFSDPFISSVNDEYTIAIWDATAFTITFYKWDGSSYVFVRSEDASLGVGREGLYTISSKLNQNLVIDVTGCSATNGANIQAWTNNYSPAQTFRFISAGGGYYYIQNIVTGKVIDVDSAKQDPGTNVHQWERNNTAAQKWYPLDTGDGDGTCYLISACNGLYLDMQYGGNTSGTNIWVYTGNQTNAQKFYLNKVSQTVADGTYKVVSEVSKPSVEMVLDVLGGSLVDGGNINIYQSNNTPAQVFEFRFNPATGYYWIINPQSGLYVDVTGGSFEAGTNVWQYTANGTTAQMWRVIENVDGSYTIISATGQGCVLDVVGASSENFTNVWIYTPNNTIAQKWKLVPVL